MIMIILGPQASGKGTQAARLAEHYGLFHFSTGDALRAEIKTGSDLGEEIARIINAGGLVSDELIYGIVRKVYKEHPEGLLLDGFPRTLNQAELAALDFVVDAVVKIVIRAEVSVERISSRLVCSECGAGYNLVSLPPKTPGVCDKDGAPLVQRDDDKPEAVRKRLGLYRQWAVPVMEFYEDLGVPVHRIDGEQSIEDVFEAIKSAIDG